ncbi:MULTISPECIES: hypothetical protein [Ehrlichia]|uniref:Putative membrane protein n=1 Tax=Ehrlichia cf. muris str. EmCRT TaxID=1359167 RepID=A0A0F3NGF5_9RICK|nr:MULTISPECIES: hypothetical protein [Ehrlichia]KJV65984.1 putative membrane protein [Ehrlichia cf. muris str. EmCRT]OUC04792.1 hypothetical protein DB91_01175 [Ehrlichia sp. Wisconsin_h]
MRPSSYVIHQWQMSYIVLSVLYLTLLTGAFFIILYGSSNIKFLGDYLFLTVAALSFISQFINITCNILNIINVKRELGNKLKQFNKDSRSSMPVLSAKKQLIVAVGFIGESMGFCCIASVLLILGAHLMPFNSVALPMRLFNIFASSFSVMYGYVLLIKGIQGNAASKESSSMKVKLHAKWVLLNSILFLSLGIYNILYETALHEVLDFYTNHSLAMLLKATVFIGYAVVLTSIFFSQVFTPHHAVGTEHSNVGAGEVSEEKAKLVINEAGLGVKLNSVVDVSKAQVVNTCCR